MVAWFAKASVFHSIISVISVSYKWLNHKKNDRKWSNFDRRKCQQNAERQKFDKNINRYEKSLNASISAPRPLRTNPNTVYFDLASFTTQKTYPSKVDT